LDSLCDNGRIFNDATDLLSAAAVAERLGVHRATVYRYVQEGELPAIRLGEDGPLRIRSDVLEQWLAQYPVVPREEMSHGRA
jgi:excisionase family DNA binding protein